MSKKIILEGCGNTFLLYDEIKNGKLKDRKHYVLENADKNGVDGVLFVTKKKDNVEMIIYDRDGTLETMCGNGIRCFTRYAHDQKYIDTSAKIETGDGIKTVEIINDELISVNMGIPRGLKKYENDHFVYTGVPHYVRIVEKLDLDTLTEEGKKLRYDEKLQKLFFGAEHGLCANFIKILDKNTVEIMTYEMGVEKITQACGTGSTAAAFIANHTGHCQFPIIVKNPGGNLAITYENKILIMIGPAKYVKK